MEDRSILRNRAYIDVASSSKAYIFPWNRPCVHDRSAESTEIDFTRLTKSDIFPAITNDDIQALSVLCRCCLRLTPSWPRLVSESIAACFYFPDSVGRGLLWRNIIYIIRNNYPVGLVNRIRHDIGFHLSAPEEFFDVIVVGGGR